MAYHGKYNSPIELLRDERLSRQEKIEMLKSWREDKEAFMRAAEDGMHGDDRSHILKDIEDALSSLQENGSGQ